MRDLRSLSGPWVGFWVQARVRGEMRLTLRFGESSVGGEGNDSIGPFDVLGRHDAEGGVDFAKTYPSHRVDYRGTWDDAMIAGIWHIRGAFLPQSMATGEFEIWPLSDDEAIERMEAALAGAA